MYCIRRRPISRTLAAKGQYTSILGLSNFFLQKPFGSLFTFGQTADAGSLEDCAKAGGFWDVADAFLLRRGRTMETTPSAVFVKIPTTAIFGNAESCHLKCGKSVFFHVTD